MGIADIGGDGFLIHELLDHIIQFFRIAEAQGVEKEVGDRAVGKQNQNQFMVILRPASGLDFIFVRVQALLLRQRVKIIRRHRGVKDAVGGTAAESHHREGVVRVDLAVIHPVHTVDMGACRIGVFDRRDIVFDIALGLKIALQRAEVIGFGPRKHAVDHRPLGNVIRSIGTEIILFRHLRDHCGKIKAGAGDLHRIAKQRLFLGVLDVFVYTVGKRED